MKYLSNSLKAISKKISFKIFVVTILLCSFFINNSLQAQITVRTNTASQTIWGPVGFNYVNYYYLPEADVFYSVSENKFFYPEGNKWVSANALPSQYNVDLFNTYKVVVNKPKPYLNHGYYVSNYAKYKKGAPKQVLIRESNEPKYYIIQNHPKHNLYKEEKKIDKKIKHKIKEDGKHKVKHSDKAKNKNHSDQKHHDKKNNK